jgi:MSHA biogenesis protein MshI
MLSFFKRTRVSGSRLGVFVTPDGVAAAQVANAAGAKPRLERCVFEARATGEQAARVIGRLASRRARAVNVLDPGGYRLLLVETPEVPPDELRAAVRWRIKDLIDFHIDDAVIDVFEMPAHARGGRNRTMYAVTAKAEVVKQQIDLVESAGLRLDVIDIPELCLRNVAALLETADRGAALLYLAERRSTLLLVRQGVLYLARHVETGTATLAEAGELRGDLIAGLALEMRRSLDYFESHYEQTGITQVHTSGLDEADRAHLAGDLGLAVNDVELERLLDTDVVLDGDAARRCLPAIGAALRRDALAP